MKNSKRIKEVLVQLAVDDKLPLDLNELDSTIFAFADQNDTIGGWSLEDVYHKAKEMERELSEEDAINIFSELEHRFDASIGISWDTVEFCINCYF